MESSLDPSMRYMPSIYHYVVSSRSPIRATSQSLQVTYVTYLSLARTGGCVVPPYCTLTIVSLKYGGWSPSIVRTRHVENDVYTHSTGSSAPRLLWVQTLQTFEVQWGIFEIKIGSAAYGMVYHHLGEMKFVGVIRARCGPTGMGED